MAASWLDHIGTYNVEKREIPRPGGAAYLALKGTPSGCLHTTEGYDVDSAVAYNASQNFGSHFYVGEGRIIQCRPLTAQASSLRAHNDLYIQIESVAFSQQKPYLPATPTLSPLLAVMGWLKDNLGIPLRRPDGWHDDCSDIKTILASNNTRRQSGLALTFHGWVGHLDVPDQDPTWHWDPGAFRYADAFALIQAPARNPQGDDDVALDDYINGQNAYQAKYKAQDADPGEPDKDRPAHFKAGWNDARFAANQPRGNASPSAGYTKDEADNRFSGKSHGHEVKGQTI